MTKQTINIGAVASDGTGDKLRTAFGKANDNFTELYNGAQTTSSTANTALSTAISSFDFANTVSSVANAAAPALKRIAIVDTTTPHTVDFTKDVIIGDCNAAGGNLSIVLPATGVDGYEVCVKCINSASATYEMIITVDDASSRIEVSGNTYNTFGLGQGDAFTFVYWGGIYRLVARTVF